MRKTIYVFHDLFAIDLEDCFMDVLSNITKSTIF